MAHGSDINRRWPRRSLLPTSFSILLASCGGGTKAESDVSRELHQPVDAGDASAQGATTTASPGKHDAGGAPPPPTPTTEQPHTDASIVAPVPDAGAAGPGDAAPAPSVLDAAAVACDACGVAGDDPEHLWLYSAGAEGRLHHVQDPRQRLVDVVGPSESTADGTSWNQDGSLAARLEAEVLSFYRLEASAELEQVLTVPGAESLLRWVSASRVLLSGSNETGPLLLLADLDGSVDILGNSLETAALLAHTSSPQVGELLYTTPTLDGTAYPLYRVYAASSYAEPELIASYAPSPILESSWSPNGELLVFGISGPPDGGIYIWRAGGGSPVRVSRDGDGYTPYFSPSPDGARLVMYVSGTAGAELLLVDADGQPGTPQSLALGDSTSPALWSATGTYLVYDTDDKSWLRRVNDSAQPIEIPGRTYGCPVAWLGSEAFAYAACAEDGELRLGRVDEMRIVIEHSLPIPVQGLTSNAEHACVVGWTANALYFFSDWQNEAEYAQISAEQPSQVTLSSDGSGVAWAQGNAVYWQQLRSCEAVGAPVLVDAHPEDVRHLEWLNRGPRSSVDD